MAAPLPVSGPQDGSMGSEWVSFSTKSWDVYICQLYVYVYRIRISIHITYIQMQIHRHIHRHIRIIYRYVYIYICTHIASLHPQILLRYHAHVTG